MNDALAHRVEDDLGGVVEVQLLHEIGTVRLLTEITSTTGSKSERQVRLPIRLGFQARRTMTGGY